jgi:hypothetical protein
MPFSIPSPSKLIPPENSFQLSAISFQLVRAGISLYALLRFVADPAEPQGLKPHVYFASVAARLKSRPFKTANRSRALSPVPCPLFPVHCPLFTVHCSLFTVH